MIAALIGSSRILSERTSQFDICMATVMLMLSNADNLILGRAQNITLETFQI